MPHRGPFGFGPGPGHRFERGDIKYVILDLLQEHPSYGYEIIRALEQRFFGFYSPSPGVVYPTLQWLQDLGYVTVQEQDGRKVYTITDAGRTFLAANQTVMDEIWSRMGRWRSHFDRHEIHDLMHEIRDVARDLGREARWADPEKMRRVRDVVMRASHDIESILRESPAGPASGQAAGPSAAAGGQPEPPSSASRSTDQPSAAPGERPGGPDEPPTDTPPIQF